MAIVDAASQHADASASADGEYGQRLADLLSALTDEASPQLNK